MPNDPSGWKAVIMKLVVGLWGVGENKQIVSILDAGKNLFHKITLKTLFL